MKKMIVMFLTIAFTTASYAINEYFPGDTLYVWAESGLNLRQSASTDGMKVTTLPYGSWVVVQNHKYSSGDSPKKIKVINSVKLQNRYTPSYKVEGNWVFVITENYEGYLYDGFLSALPPVQATHTDQYSADQEITYYEPLPNYLERVFGLVSDSQRIQKSEYRLDQTRVYGNGAIHLAIMEDYSGGDEYIIPQVSLQEGYLLMNMILRLEMGNKLKAEDFLFQSILIKKTDQKLIFLFDEVDSSCTLEQVGNFIHIRFDYGSGC